MDCEAQEIGTCRATAKIARPTTTAGARRSREGRGSRRLRRRQQADAFVNGWFTPDRLERIPMEMKSRSVMASPIIDQIAS